MDNQNKPLEKRLREIRDMPSSNMTPALKRKLGKLERLKKLYDSASDDCPRFVVRLDDNCNSKEPYILEVTDSKDKTTEKSYATLFDLSADLFSRTSCEDDCRLNVRYKSLNRNQIAEVYSGLASKFSRT